MMSDRKRMLPVMIGRISVAFLYHQNKLCQSTSVYVKSRNKTEIDEHLNNRLQKKLISGFIKMLFTIKEKVQNYIGYFVFTSH